MAAAEIALEAYKGEDAQFNGTHRVSAAGAVVDISSWTIVFTARRNATDADPALLSVPATIVSGVAGTYKVLLSAAQTLALGVGDFDCDVWRTNSGSETEMAVGHLTILQPVKNP